MKDTEIGGGQGVVVTIPGATTNKRVTTVAEYYGTDAGKKDLGNARDYGVDGTDGHDS